MQKEAFNLQAFLYDFCACFLESKKDSSSSQLKETEVKLQKSIDDAKLFNEKIKTLESKLDKQDQAVS